MNVHIIGYTVQHGTVLIIFHVILRQSSELRCGIVDGSAYKKFQCHLISQSQLSTRVKMLVLLQVLRLHKLLLTHLTGKRAFTCVTTHVIGQVSELQKLCFADVTRIWPLSRVAPNVHLHCCGAWKLLLTNSALHLLIPISGWPIHVGRHVQFQLVQLPKRFSASIAGKRPNVAVCVFVHSQRAQSSESFAAHLTGERPFVCVNPGVFLQVISAHKLLLTYVARERFRSGVGKNVNFQFVRPRELSFAEITCEWSLAGMAKHVLLQVLMPGEFPVALVADIASFFDFSVSAIVIF